LVLFFKKELLSFFGSERRALERFQPDWNDHVVLKTL